MHWKEELRNNVNTIRELGKYIRIPDIQARELENLIELHPMSITRYYISLIDKDNPQDPILKMIVPSLNELDTEGSYDTSGELANTVINGLQHKYKNTALITTTNFCTAYCRYCFRKRIVGTPDEDVKAKIRKISSYIRQHPVIHNALVSGGDPLILDNELIQFILEELTAIPTLDFIRFGTKIPVVFPQRILGDRKLVALFSKYANHKKQIYIVTHFNHPKEITPQAIAAVSALRNAGLIINNQTVLMKGINDSPDILESLLRNLIRIGVNPYYIFQCRPVKRVKNHFPVSLRRGIEIVEQTRSRLDGHAKRFKYVMSHFDGKIEILGILDNEVILKYHQAKNPANNGRLFRQPIHQEAAWLDDLEDRIPASVYSRR